MNQNTSSNNIPQKFPGENEWIPLSLAARLTPYSPEYLSLLARKKKLPAKKIDNVWYTTKTILDGYMRKQMLREQAQNGVIDPHKINTGTQRFVGEQGAQFIREEKEAEILEKTPEVLAETKTDLSAFPPKISVPEKKQTVPVPDAKQSFALQSIKEKVEKIHDSVSGISNKFDAAFPALPRRGDTAHPFLPPLKKKVAEPELIKEIKEIEELVGIEEKTLPIPVTNYKLPATNLIPRAAKFALGLAGAMALAFFLVFPIPVIFGAFDLSLEGIRNWVKDSQTVLGFRPGTGANELLLLDKNGNISIKGDIETDGQVKSFAPQGTPPLLVQSSTTVENLSAEYMNGLSEEELASVVLSQVLEEIKTSGLSVSGSSGGVITRVVETKIGSGVSGNELSKRLNELENSIKSEIYRVVSQNQSGASGSANFVAIAPINKIDFLSNVTITGATITNSSFSGSASLTTLTVSGDVNFSTLTVSGQSNFATSTFSGNVAFDSNTLFIDSINNRVGIGTSSPSDTLSVNGPSYLAPIGSPAVSIDRLYNLGGDLYWAGSLIGGVTTGNWATDGTSVWRSGGNVGVGSTSPSVKLSVSGNGYFDGNLTVSNLTATGTISSATTTAVNFLATGSTTLQNFTFASATGTSATTTNFFSNFFRSVSVTIDILSASVSAFADVTITRSTTTSATTTNLYAANITNDTITATTSANLGTTTITNLSVTNSSTSTFAGGLTVADSGFVYQQATGNIGIGTTTPGSALNIFRDGSSSIRIDNFSSSPTVSPQLAFRRASGSLSSPLATQSGHRLGQLSFNGYNGSDFGSTVAAIAGYAEETFSATNQGTSLRFETTPLGSTTRLEGMRIDPAGNVGIGTTSPYTKFTVWGSGTGTNKLVNFVNSASSTLMTVLENGRVGIGTSSPATTLHVSATGAASQIRVEATDIGFDSSVRFSESGVVRGVLGYRATEDLIKLVYDTSFGSGGYGNAKGIVINNIGNVGLGTTSPYAKLSIHANNGETNTALFAIASSTASATTTHFVVTNAGGVAIGTTTSFLSSIHHKIYGEGTDQVVVKFKTTNNSTNSFSSYEAIADNPHLSFLAHGSARTVSRYGLTLGGFGEISLFTASGGATPNGLVIGTNPAVPLIFGTNNTERARIDSSGRVGIGTTTPDYSLEVLGINKTIKARNAVASDYTSVELFNDQNNVLRTLNLGYSGSTYTGPYLASGPTGEQGSLATTGAYPLVLGTNNTARLTISSTGNVGIGTTTPIDKLSIDGTDTALRITGSTRGRINIQPTTGGSAYKGWQIESPAENGNVPGGYLGIIESGVGSRFTIASSTGNVGIGTTSPAVNLQVHNISDQTIQYISTDASLNALLNFRTDHDGTPRTGSIGFDYSDDLIRIVHGGAFDGSVNGIAIDSAGEVGIGNSSPGKTLDVTGTGRFSSTLTISNTTSCTGGSALQTNGSGDVACGTVVSGGAGTAGGWTTNNIGDVTLATSTDRVGIGATTSPYAKLTVLSGSIATTTLALLPASGQTANIIDIYNTSGVLTSAMTAAGRLGIGTTTPEGQLMVAGGPSTNNLNITDYTAANSPTLRIRSDGTNIAYLSAIGSAATDFGAGTVTSRRGNVVLWGDGTGTKGVEIVANKSDAYFRVFTGGNADANERLRITSAGSVGIGTTSPYAKLSVVGPVVAEYFYATSTTATSTFVGRVAIGNGGTPSHAGLSNTGGLYVKDYLEIDNGAFFDNGLCSGTTCATASFADGQIVAIGNIGAGTTSPWGKLSVTQTGTGGAPSFIVEDSASPDTTPFIIDQAGNVGIGTVNPESLLQISGAAAIDGSNPVTFNINNTTNSNSWVDGSIYSQIVFASDDASFDGVRAQIAAIAEGNNGNGSATGLGFFTGDGGLPAEILRINNDGRVGISTTTPWAKFSVINSTSLPSFIVEDSSPDTTPFIIDFSGNVGIGSSSPSTKLVVAGDVSIDTGVAGGGNLFRGENAGVELRARQSAYVTDQWNAQIYQSGTSAGSYPFSAFGHLIIQPNTNTSLGGRDIILATGSGTPEPRLVVKTTSGNVGIGTTSPYAKLSIHANSSETNTTLFSVASSTASATTTHFVVRNDGNIGIGTLSPSETVEIFSSSNYRELKIKSTGGGAFLSLDRATTGNRAGLEFHTGGTQRWEIGLNSNTTDNFNIGTASFGSTYLTILNSNGFVGIGTTSPTVLLTVGSSTPNNILSPEYYKSAYISGDLEVDGTIYGTVAGTITPNIGNNIVLATNSSGVVVGTSSPSFANIFATSSTATSTFAGGLAVDTTDFVVDPVSGRVGIGTASPDWPLTISGSLAGQGLHVDSSSGAAVSIDRGATTNNAVLYFSTAGAEKWGIGNKSQSNEDLYLYIAGSTSATHTFEASGDVGFGTTTPSKKLSVSIGNSSNLSNGLLVERGTGGYNGIMYGLKSDASGVYRGAISAFDVNNNELEAISITTAASGLGNIGIGSTSPSEKLVVSGGNTLLSTAAPILYFNETDQTDPLGWWRQVADGGEWTFRRRTSAGTWTGEVYPLRFLSNDDVRLGGSGGFIYYDASAQNVGIGTTSPTNLFSVSGASNIAGHIRTSTTRSQVYITGPEAVGNLQELSFGTEAVNSSIYQTAIIRGIITQASPSALISDLQFFTNTGDSVTEKMRITGAGSVGIGTANPTEVIGSNVKLNVAGPGIVIAVASTTDNTISSRSVFVAAADSSFLDLFSHSSAGTTVRYGITLGGWTEITAFNNFGTNNGMIVGTNSATPLVLGTNNVERLRILSGGNVGIGTTTPDTKVNVYDTTAITSFTGSQDQGVRIAGGSSLGNYSLLGFTTPFSSNFYAGSNLAQIGARFESNGSYLQFGTSNTFTSGITNTAMTIDPSGDVGIGTTTPDTLLTAWNKNAIHVGSGSVSGGGYIDTNGVSALYLAGGAQYSTGAYTYTAKATAASGLISESGILRFFTDAGLTVGNTFAASQRMVIDTSGNVGIGTTTPYSLLSLSNSASTPALTPLFTIASTTGGNSTTTLLTVLSTGAVGINNSAPAATSKLTITGATSDTALQVTGVTTGTAVSAATITTGTAITATAITTGTGMNCTVTTSGKCLTFNTTGAGLTTGGGLNITGSANMTADYTGAFVVVTPTRNVSAAATRIHSGNIVNISPVYSTSGSSNSVLNITGTTTNIVRTLSNASTGAVASTTAIAPVLAVANTTIATNNVIDSSNLVSFMQLATSSTGTLLSVLNNGSGNLASFTGRGNFGIGTTTPTVLLTVGSSTPNDILSSEYYKSAYISGDLEVDGTFYAGSAFNPNVGNNIVLSTNSSGVVIGTSSPSFASFFATSSTATSTIAGNLGIGNVSPGLMYPEAAQLVVGSGVGGQGITVFAGTGSLSRIHFADGTTGNQQFRGYMVYNHSVDAFQIGTSALEVVRIDSAGDFGIGDTDPTYKLDVAGNGRFTSFVDAAHFVATSTTATSTFAGGLAVDTSDFVVDPDGGLVGIGTASPLRTLDVRGILRVGPSALTTFEPGDIPGDTGAIILTSNTGQSRQSHIWQDDDGVGLGGLYIQSTHNPIVIEAGTQSGNNIILNPAGSSVGIGTTTPTEKLHIAGANPVGLYIENNASAGSYATLANSTADGPFVAAHTESGGTTSTGNFAAMKLRFGAGGFQVFSSPATAANSARAFTERLSITTSGLAGFGTTTPWGQLSASSTSAFPTLAIEQKSTGPAAVILGGNVGIGNTSPQELFHIGAGGDAAGVSATNLLITSAGASALSVRDSTSDVETFVYADSAGGIVGTLTNHDLRFRTNNADVARIDAAGDFGVGTTSPGYRLSVTGGDIGLDTGGQIDFFDEVSDKIYLFQNAYGIGIEGSTLTNWSGSQFRWRTGGTSASSGTERMILTTTGLGIGTTTPRTNLHISDTGTATTLGQLDTNFRLETRTGTVNAGSEISFMGSATGATLDQATYAAISAPVTANGAGTAGYLSFSTKTLQSDSSLSERMRITGGGFVGIGTTSPFTDLGVEGTFISTTTDAQFAVGNDAVVGINSAFNVTGVLARARVSKPNVVVQLGTTNDTGSSFAVYDNGTTLRFGARADGVVSFTGLGTTDTATYLCRNSLNQVAACSGTAAGAAFIQNGNSFGATAVLGTNDASDLQFETGGTTKLTIVNSTGNVGIGTTSPNFDSNSARFLMVSGESIGTNNFGEVGVGGNVTNINGALGSFSFVNSSLSTVDKRNASIVSSNDGATNSGNLAFFTANAGSLTEKMHITSSGNVGIGTTTPNQKLSIFANAADAAIEFSTVSGPNEKWTIGIDDSDAAKFKIASSSALGTSDRLVINGSGYVGIGTANPQSTLDLGNGSNGNSLVWGGNGTNWYATIGTSFSSADLNILNGLKLDTDSDSILYSYGGGAIAPAGIRTDFSTGDILFFNEASGVKTAGNTFDYAANTKLTIKVSGKVGIGTTTPWGQLSASSTSAFPTLAIEQKSTGPAAVILGGNVGIGTTTPQWLLNLFSSSAPQLSLSAGAGIAQWAFRNAGGNFYLATTTVAGTATSSPSALTIIGSTGNVGIATTSPVQTLSVEGTGAYIHQTTSSIAPALKIVDRSPSGSDIGFHYENFGGTGDVVITNNGFIGVGSTSPMSVLSVSQAFAAGRTAVVTIDDTDGLGGPNDGMFIDYRGGGGILGRFGAEFDGTRGNFVFREMYNGGTGSTEIMRISGNGNVGIGTSSPYAALSVVGSSGVVAGKYTATSSTATSTFAGFIDVNGTGTNATSTFASNLWVKGTLRTGTGSIYMNDTSITAGNGAFQLNTVGNSYINTATFGIGTTSAPQLLSVGANNNISAYFAGAIGIGISTPTALLSVNATSTPTVTKQTTSDFSVSGSTNSAGIATSSNQITLNFATTTNFTDTFVQTVPSFTFSRGSNSLVRPDGKVLTILGGLTANTTIYNPDTNIFISGPALASGTASSSSHSIIRPDGKFLVINAGASATTNIYNPAVGSTGSFSTGPSLSSGTAGAGSNSIVRPDGKFLVVNANNTAVTNIYDPTTNTFIAGPSLASGSAGVGSHSLQRPDGKFLIINGNSTATTNIYDPITNTFSTGPSLASGTVGPGGHSIQIPDGKFLVINGGSTVTTNIYNPITNTFVAGPSNVNGAGPGSHSLQRPDGKWILFAAPGSVLTALYNPATNTFANGPIGGGASPQNGAHSIHLKNGKFLYVPANGSAVNIYDAGWAVYGSHESEDLNISQLNQSSLIRWSSNGEGLIQVAIKTATSQGGLTSASYATTTNNALVQPVNNAAWAKVRVTLTRTIPQMDQPQQPFVGKFSWPGESDTKYQRDFAQPILYDFTIDNQTVYRREGADFGSGFATSTSSGNATTSGPTLSNLIGGDNGLTLPYSIGFLPNNDLGYVATSTATTTNTVDEGAMTLQRPDGKYVIFHGQNTTGTTIYDPYTNTVTTGPTTVAGIYYGSTAIQRPDGKFLIVDGGDFDTTEIYDPWANTFTAGPNLTGAAFFRSIALKRPDGKFLIYHTTQSPEVSQLASIYDPIANTMVSAATTTGILAYGALSIQRPDGKYLVVHGNNNTLTTLVDLVTGIATSGPVTTGNVYTGAQAIQRPDGKLLIVHGNNLTTTSIYDPVANIMSAGPAMSGNISPGGITGSTALQRPDGKFLITHGFNSTGSTLYDPVANTAIPGPTLPSSLFGEGTHWFQRPDGKYQIISAAVQNFMYEYDAGWITNGMYESEYINNTQLKSQSALIWTGNADAFKQGAVSFEVRTASSNLALATTTWRTIKKSGDLINPLSGDAWMQVRIVMNRTIPAYPGASKNVYGSLAQVMYNKLPLQAGAGIPSVNQSETFIKPTITSFRIIQANNSDLAAFSVNGENLFRFSAGGDAFTGQGGSWNSGGADIAEYFPTDDSTLEAGELVTIAEDSSGGLIAKSTRAYDDNLLGIITTTPGVKLGIDITGGTAEKQPVALAGRVPVKVSLENGVIKKGDYLTSSSIPGVAMKATDPGRVVGIALEGFDGNCENLYSDPASGSTNSICSEENGTGKILVYVNPHTYLGSSFWEKTGSKLSRWGYLVSKAIGELGINVTEEGNIGIGTTTPTAFVTVASSLENPLPAFDVYTGVGSESAFSVAKNGFVGIGTSTPGTKLSIAGGNVSVIGGAICASGNDANTCFRSDLAPGGIYGKTLSLSGTGLAEKYKVSDISIVAGDIVAVSASSTTPGSLEKVTPETRGQVIGVVAENPGIVLGEDEYSNEVNENRNVVSSGRAVIRVTTERGPIKAGDRISISPSLSGAGAKATSSDYTIGIALEDFDPGNSLNGSATTTSVTNGFYDGLILASVQLGWSKIDNSIANLSGSFYSLDGTTGKISGLAILDLGGASLTNISSIASASGKWGIDQEGNFVGESLAVRGSIEVGSPDRRTGITMYDETTGYAYCFTVRDGLPTTTSGPCSSSGSATSTPSAAPASSDSGGGLAGILESLSQSVSALTDPTATTTTATTSPPTETATTTDPTATSTEPTTTTDSATSPPPETDPASTTSHTSATSTTPTPAP